LWVGNGRLDQIPNPQSPIPNPQSPIPNKKFINKENKNSFDLNKFNKLIQE